MLQLLAFKQNCVLVNCLIMNNELILHIIKSKIMTLIQHFDEILVQGDKPNCKVYVFVFAS